MCGIVGYLKKNGTAEKPLGATLLNMLQALSCRGPDSAGVAVFRPESPFWILRIKLPETDKAREAAGRLVDLIQSHAGMVRHSVQGSYLCLEVERTISALELEEFILGHCPQAEVVSLGHRLEIVKQVGSPTRLEQSFAISGWDGSHGIGHTRMSTESRVDLSHSQPFWAHGIPDLATVHNGHITNYHKLRRHYEQSGHRFFTDNDSEVIGVYLRDRLAAGLTLEDALRSSLDDFDGSFSYLAAGVDCLAYVKDRFGFKPLIVAETPDFAAIATEEIALRQTLGEDFVAREPPPGAVSIWTVPAAPVAATPV
jgi:glutamate synthase domain-containing protein 1